MFGKNWEMIKRGLAVALSASLLAGTMTVSASLPTAAASGSRVETDAKGGVTITLDGREVWQAASAAMQKADAVTGDIADRIMAQTGSNGNPVVLEDDIYEMELPENALRGLPAGLGMDMYISAEKEAISQDIENSMDANNNTFARILAEHLDADPTQISTIMSDNNKEVAA